MSKIFFFRSISLLKLYIDLIRPCVEYCSHIWGGTSSACLLDRVELKAFYLISNKDLTDPLIPSLSAIKWPHSLFSIDITLVIALQNSKIGCLTPSPGPVVLARLLPPIDIVSSCATLVLSSTVTVSSLLPLGFGTLYLLLFSQILIIFLPSRVRSIVS